MKYRALKGNSKIFRRAMLLSLMAAATFHLSAQQKDSFDFKKQLYIGIVPQYIFMDGFKMDFTGVIARKWMAYLSPEYYSGEANYNDSGKVSGLGGQIGIKYILSEERKPGKSRAGSRFFVGLGGNYNRFTIKSNSFNWVEYQEDGLTYYRYDYTDVFRYFDRKGVDMFIGLQKTTESRFYFEFQMGMSLRSSTLTTSAHYEPENSRDRRFYDFGYSGLCPVMNFRLGFVLD